eukprot:scaffold3428_cov379-Prasinococcus_capsulatus_cf.AAC.30
MSASWHAHRRRSRAAPARHNAPAQCNGQATGARCGAGRGTPGTSAARGGAGAPRRSRQRAPLDVAPAAAEDARRAVAALRCVAPSGGGNTPGPTAQPAAQ